MEPIRLFLCLAECARRGLSAVRSGLLLSIALLGLCGCSNKETAPADGAAALKPVRLILDYLPNAKHVGLYQAEAAGYFREEGLAVTITTPTSSSDTLRLMAAGQADFGIVTLLDFMIVRAGGEPLKIILALDQRPLTALVALEKSGIVRPRDLAGRTVGVTGLASDEALVKWAVGHDGGDPASVRIVNIGFSTAQQVIAGNVDAATGFWNQEGLQVAASQPARVLRFENYGAPPYPEVVLFAREDFLQREPETARRFLRAVVHGYRDAIENPEAAGAAMAARVEGDTAEGLKPYVAALRPVFQADAPAYGYVNLPVLKDYLQWIREMKAVDFRADPATFATNEFLPSAAVPESAGSAADASGKARP